MNKIVDVLTAESSDAKLGDSRVYALASPWCKKFYIGATSRSFGVRWKEHTTCGRKKRRGQKPNLYRWMHRFGAFKYILLPVAKLSFEDAKRTEPRIINALCPTLNQVGTRSARVERRRRKRLGKEERARLKNKENYGGKTTSSLILFDIDGMARSSLAQALREGTQGMRMKTRGGQTWTDKWSQLRSKYGSTVLRQEGTVFKLSEARSKIEPGGEFWVEKIIQISVGVEKKRKFLALILKQPRRAAKLAVQSVDYLVGLFRTAGTFSMNKTRNALRIKIDRAFRKKTGTNIRSRITVKVKYDSIVSLKKVREALATVIRENNSLGRSEADILIARSRVVWEKNKTVGQLIHNQRSCLLRGYDQVCRCEFFPNTPKINEHVLCRVSELKATPGFVKNSKNVPAPHQDSSRQADITEGIRGAVNTRWPNCSINMERFSYLQKAETKSAAMTTTEVRAWAAEFSQLVFVPVDRKNGETLLLCPTTFLRSLGKDRCLVAGIRMMDDASVFVAEDPKSRDPRGKAADILARFQDTYHEDLTLVRKDEGQNVWDFIGGMVMMCTNPTQVLFWTSSRNMTQLAKEGNLKVQGVQDFSSYTPKQVKKNAVYGMIKRCIDLATMEILAIPALYAIFHETLLREYPPEVFLGGLAKLARLKASNGLLEVARVAAAMWGVTLQDGSHKHGRG
ncbi:hypothetical protein CBR_g48581 [Chara braunii]|uniref:GIY-YIG domain-containing protein n=1 Tax=Chara braunii TaxID=69332 RepID=A0A388M346_CHABU|nr:hypothetical protein CBR_g48581 [Chara braunii]|eukprot:GBG88971.1 hypothetical protein CBR_g48581 [Chara braunii]